MTLSHHINQFRVASRELFNGYFRAADPWNRTELAWALEERFSAVESLLFQKLVTEQASLHLGHYGDAQPHILVVPRTDSVPWMLNRETDSGYWDGSPDRVTQEARLFFIGFFDWDQLAIRDNRYVRVKVAHWAAHPETIGKHALMETQHVEYVEA
jgi:hypothetical protein